MDKDGIVEEEDVSRLVRQLLLDPVDLGIIVTLAGNEVKRDLRPLEVGFEEPLVRLHVLEGPALRQIGRLKLDVLDQDRARLIAIPPELLAHPVLEIVERLVVGPLDAEDASVGLLCRTELLELGVDLVPRIAILDLQHYDRAAIEFGVPGTLEICPRNAAEAKTLRDRIRISFDPIEEVGKGNLRRQENERIEGMLGKSHPFAHPFDYFH